MSAPAVLVMAKAPEPGRVKTRLGAVLGMAAAAELAAAALLDTLEVAEVAFGPGRRYLALDGDPRASVAAAALEHRLRGWTVLVQRGDGFGSRLAHAHRDAAGRAGAPVVQIGMDTPHVTADRLAGVADLVAGRPDAVLGPAEDGGWWVLAVTDPAHTRGLPGVAMSTPRTCRDTRAALEAAGARVAGTATLHDVDTVGDAARAARAAPGSRFAAAWAAVAAGAAS